VRRATRRSLGLAAVLLLAAGCGAPTPAPTGTPAPTPSASTSSPSPSPTSPSATTTPTTSTSTAPTTTPPTTKPPTTTPPPTTKPPTTTPPPSPTATGIPASLLGQDVRVIPTSRKVVALTFDADVRAIAAAGHVIGNHTMTHPHSTQITDAELTAEVRDAAAAISAITGRTPKPWFRFPYGERTYADVLLLNGLGYICVSWTVDTLGWLGEEAGTAEDVTARVIAALQPGEIVLMHIGANPYDGTTYDADSLGATIDAIRAKGYGFTTVEALLG